MSEKIKAKKIIITENQYDMLISILSEAGGQLSVALEQEALAMVETIRNNTQPHTIIMS